MRQQDKGPAKIAIIRDCSELLVGRGERSYAFDSVKNREGAEKCQP